MNTYTPLDKLTRAPRSLAQAQADITQQRDEATQVRFISIRDRTSETMALSVLFEREEIDEQIRREVRKALLADEDYQLCTGWKIAAPVKRAVWDTEIYRRPHYATRKS